MKSFLRPLLFFAFSGVVLCSQASAAAPAVAYSQVASLFSAPQGFVPDSAVIRGTDGNIYGTTTSGGAYGLGAIFKIDPAGDLTRVYSFQGKDGIRPTALIRANDGNFYGLTSAGGASYPTSSNGTIFRLTPQGVVTPLCTFYNYATGSCLFQGADGSLYGTTTGSSIFRCTLAGAVTFQTAADAPIRSFMQASDGNFYGVTVGSEPGPSSSFGTIFQLTAGGGRTTLFTFGGTNGSNPVGLVEGTDGFLYGVTTYGGSDYYYSYVQGSGTIFRISTSGTFTSLVSFYGSSGAPYGSNIRAPLIRGSDGNLYGVARHAGGGTNMGTIFKFTPGSGLSLSGTFDADVDYLSTKAALMQAADGSFYGTTPGNDITQTGGTVFKVNTDKLATTLFKFRNVNGNYSTAPLLLGTDGNLYGTASQGGAFGSGTLFRVAPDGQVSPLITFNGNNGAAPQGALIQAKDGNLYGTTSSGGAYHCGTVFKLTLAGDLTTLVSFKGKNGYYPSMALIQAKDGNFYGTTTYGGTSYNGTLGTYNPGYGTVFKLTPAGVLTTLFFFNASSTTGRIPSSPLLEAKDGNFYGTTSSGGSTADAGTVFKVTPAGVLTKLVTFNRENGAEPQGGLIQAKDGYLYGTTRTGTLSAPILNFNGTVFRVSLTGAFTSLATMPSTIVGAEPACALFQAADGNFYGTTGGTIYNTSGLFKMTPAGVLSSVIDLARLTLGEPQTGVIPDREGNLCGVTQDGGPGDAGVIYRVRISPLKNQTITFPTVEGATYGQTVTLKARSSSGLAVKYRVLSGPGTLADNKLTFTRTGVVKVAASAPASFNYLAAVEVMQAITVSQASQSIGAFPTLPALKYPSSPVKFTLPVASSGLAVKVTVQSGPARISGNTLTTQGTGRITLVAEQAGNINYMAAKPVKINWIIQAR